MILISTVCSLPDFSELLSLGDACVGGWGGGPDGQPYFHFVVVSMVKSLDMLNFLIVFARWSDQSKI